MMGRSTTTLLSFLAVLLLSAAQTVSAKDSSSVVGTSIHDRPSHGASHAEIEAELSATTKAAVEGFTCTVTGASGQDQCDAANDDDGSGCVWCVLNSFGFCVSETQAEQFKQVMPTIDCDDDGGSDDDKAPPVPDNDDSPLWNCLESEDEADCSSDACVWCDTKGGFGVCLTPEGAAMAKDSYWFDCKDAQMAAALEGRDDDDDDDASLEEEEDDEEEGDYSDDDDEEEEEDDEDDMNEFVVDTNCVMAALILDPNDDDVTSEEACFAARDVAGNPCEWCSVAGSPFRLCLSTPQAQVAEYVGAACTGSDESFEPEDFDDSCIARHTTATDGSALSKEGCWAHQDLDGNGCEWCNMMGVEVCLGGVQAELVEHWGATCVMDTEEHDLATEAIEQHLTYLLAAKDARDKQQPPAKNEDGEEELDLATLWLTSDPSCVVTTLRAAAEGEDEQEAACAKMMDAEGNPCSWCEMGTGFNMCLNDEQAEVAEFMGLACGPFDDEDEKAEDLYDFDPSCIMAMQNGPDEGSCVAAKDADGNKCEWCSYQSFSACLSPEQAGMVEPFGVSCDKTETRFAELPPVEQEKHQLAPKDIDTSCLVNMDEQSCEASQDDIANKACEWCSLGSLGISGCMSADQADMAKPLGVTCNAATAAAEEQTQQQQVKDLPPDFWSCLSQSTSVDDCDETCTWCDVKGANGGAGFCLSDPIADAVTNYSGDSYLDCTEPAEEEDVATKTKPNLGDIIVEAMEDSIA